MTLRPLYLLPFALLLGAGDDTVLLQGPLPSCRSGEFLTMKDGAPRCLDPVYAQLLTAPDCTGRLVHALTAEGDRWACTDKGPLSPDDAAALPGRVTRAQAALEALRKNRAAQPALSRFVGVTAYKTAGRMTHTGKPPGLLSAHALCADEYPGAHLCSGFELYAAEITDVFARTPLPLSWAYHPAWKAPIAGAKDADAGLADSCGGYTYDKDDRGYSGIAAQYGNIDGNGLITLALNGGPAALCSTVLPLSCCK